MRAMFDPLEVLCVNVLLSILQEFGSKQWGLDLWLTMLLALPDQKFFQLDSWLGHRDMILTLSATVGSMYINGTAALSTFQG